MRTIIRIDHVEKKENTQTGEPYYKTYATLDDGTEAEGFGKDFDIQEKVEVFFHYGQIKMKKKS